VCAAQRKSASARRALAASGLLLASLGLVLPYFLATAGASAARERLAALALPDGFHLRGIGVGLLPLWVCVGVAGCPKRRDRGVGWIVFLAAGLVLAFLAARIVDGNQYKFPFVIALLLAIYVGVRSADLSARRRWALWVVMASAVPTTALGLVVHARAPGLITSQAERDTFAWIARNTPSDTVVVARWRATLVPVYSRRDLYIPDCVGFHRGARYDPAVWQRRTEQMERLFGRGEIVPVLEEIAGELGRPVVLITREQLLQVDEPRLRLLNAAGHMRTWTLDRGG
jgi:hypothetical protein